MDFPLTLPSGGQVIVPDNHAIITDFSAAEADKIQVFGAISDYRLEYSFLSMGALNLNTSIYKGDDLITIVQGTIDVDLARDFVSASSNVIG